MITFSVLNYGADPKGTAASTGAFQTAITAAESAGGGTVLVPPGLYVIGTIRLRSNIRLHIELGATVAGSPNFADYSEEAEGHIPPEFPYVRCLIVGFDLDNVEITGGGTIDGRGAAFMDYRAPTFGDAFTPGVLASMPEERRREYVGVKHEERPTWIIFLRRCRNIRFRDFNVRDAARWTARFSLCENVSITGMFIENDLRAANSDGMHFTGCTKVLVSDCSITSGDDCIAVTTYGDFAPSIGAVLTNCIMTSHSAAVRIGLGGGATVQDVVVSNCVLRDCNRGIGIFAGPGAVVRNVGVSGLRISTRLIAGTWWGKAEPIILTTLGPEALIENVSITDVSARSEQGILINSVPDSTVRDIRITGVRLRLASGPMSPFSAGTLDIRPHSMERRRLPGLYANGVENLSLHDVDVTIDDEARDYFSGSFESTACPGIRIAGCSGFSALDQGVDQIR